ncbi:MAG: HAD-IA family hydrolase [Bacteroidales bacterium]|nr:HAD-IA family hydrolase [Bacteroidales bacterium]
MIKTWDYILFDVIGTTVKDSSNGESIILDCFSKSFNLSGYQISNDLINKQRGKIKREAIVNILVSSKYNVDMAEKIYSDFTDLLKKSLSLFKDMNGVSKLFEKLNDKQIKIGLGSGLPKEYLLEIIKQVGWDYKMFDYIGSSEELGKGRPDPIMIYDSMNKLNIKDKSKVIKVGDTIADIQEGKNAGVVTASVLTGTQSKYELTKHSPDYIFNEVSDLINIL